MSGIWTGIFAPFEHLQAVGAVPGSMTACREALMFPSLRAGTARSVVLYLKMGLALKDAPKYAFWSNGMASSEEREGEIHGMI